ncbi:MAG: DNA-directed DNA polymerase epsilon, subunit B [Alectoria fallacina]|uniref:DNA polymerase epsilon subunit B n=1 Tax=Alectoria fallacina TaxID=1903189 RepID=A0A8H3IZS8_9LECA|nr:MAG: DNA-directed DNA polymerase epsilon, subunit B [Alectoria fallacina]
MDVEAMDRRKSATKTQTEPLFHVAQKHAHPNPIPSLSPAFSTPVHPIRIAKSSESSKPSILPILLPPATLRPLAFRTLTKKHDLMLTSSALQAFATFIGKHCGSGWREEGLAEKVLDEAAKSWKRNGGGVILPGDGDELKSILRNMERSMSGGKPSQQGGLTGQGNFAFGNTVDSTDSITRPGASVREDSEASLGVSVLGVDDDGDNIGSEDPRRWLRIVGAFEQPRLTYNVNQKHFEAASTATSLLPDPSHKTHLFRHRYNLIHQRLLRNESFQSSSVPSARTRYLQRSSLKIATTQQAYNLTHIANLLGRSGSNHLLLGLLAISPSGVLTINDLTGSIAVNIQHARPVPEDGAWFTPGMIVLVDGVYEEEGSSTGHGLDGNRGVGGTVGGKFIAFSVGGPPCERREVTVGISGAGKDGHTSAGGGFGWVDFLGVGSERAAGSAMRKLETIVLKRDSSENPVQGRVRMVICGEVELENAKTLQALKRVLGLHAAEQACQTPMVVVLMGNFVRHAVMTGGSSGGSIEYKEYFDSLASILSDYPTMLQNTTFVFVPGDNDPWASAFSAGAATAIPRNRVPDIFTTRIKRAFATARAEAEKATGKKADGEAIWSTNPTRLTLFGPAQEVVFFRDDMSGRLRRNAVRFRPLQAEKEPISSIVPDQKMIGDAAAMEEGQELSESMEVDIAVETAESHVPTSVARESATSTGLSDLQTARKLVKTILDQGYLSPFPPSNRPVLWDYAGALQLYPLPTALVLMDPEAPPFAVTYEGCHVMNPGPLAPGGRKGVAQWMEYDARTRRGKTREIRF